MILWSVSPIWQVILLPVSPWCGVVVVDIGLVVPQMPAEHKLLPGVKLVDNQKSLAKNVITMLTKHEITCKAEKKRYKPGRVEVVWNRILTSAVPKSATRSCLQTFNLLSNQLQHASSNISISIFNILVNPPGRKIDGCMSGMTYGWRWTFQRETFWARRKLKTYHWIIWGNPPVNWNKTNPESNSWRSKKMDSLTLIIKIHLDDIFVSFIFW